MARKETMAKKVRKVKRKSVKDAGKRNKERKKEAEESFEVGFEEVVIKCPSCGRGFRVVKSSSFNMEGMLCQRCAAGGGIDTEEGDES